MELWKEKYNDLYKSEEIKKKRYIMISSNIGVDCGTQNIQM